jgi:hypothetical protein
LTVLGPVGFYLANKVGAGMLYTLGVVWPWAVGLLGLYAAQADFRRSDIV